MWSGIFWFSLMFKRRADRLWRLIPHEKLRKIFRRANSESLASYAGCLQNVFHQKNTSLLNNLNTTLITPRKRFGWQSIQVSMKKHRILPTFQSKKTPSRQKKKHHSKYSQKNWKCPLGKGETSTQTTNFGGIPRENIQGRTFPRKNLKWCPIHWWWNQPHEPFDFVIFGRQKQNGQGLVNWRSSLPGLCRRPAFWNLQHLSVPRWLTKRNVKTTWHQNGKIQAVWLLLFVFWVSFYGFYHGKSPLNHNLGNIFVLFPSIWSKSNVKSVFGVVHSLVNVFRSWWLDNFDISGRCLMVFEWGTLPLKLTAPLIRRQSIPFGGHLFAAWNASRWLHFKDFWCLLENWGKDPIWPKHRFHSNCGSIIN